MTIRFNRRLGVALLVALVAGFLFKVSYLRDSIEGYTFPAVVSGTVFALSLLSLVREAFALCVDDFQSFPFVRQIPGIAMMVAGVLMIESVGMYTSAFLVLLLISYWYSPQQSWARRTLFSVALGVGFTLAMYLLFSVMLNVQTPRGWFV